MVGIGHLDPGSLKTGIYGNGIRQIGVNGGLNGFSCLGDRIPGSRIAPGDHDPLAGFGFHQVHAWFGLGIAAYILWSAIQIARESFAVLMDEELPPDVSQHMLELARGVPGVLGAHDLRTRISGNHWFVQLHLELPGELTLTVAHGISDQAADAIHQAYPRAEVLVHADPLEVVTGAKA